MTSLSNIAPIPTKTSWKKRARRIVPSKPTPLTSKTNVVGSLSRTSGATSDRARWMIRRNKAKLRRLSRVRRRPPRTAPFIEIHTHSRARGSLLRWTTQVGGAAGAGLATMYFFDPDRGRARRAKLRDQAIRVQDEALDSADILSRDLRNRAVGVGAGLRYRFTGGDVDDSVLTDRVRSTLGMLTGHAKAIDVAVTDGDVRLTGDVLAEEHHAVVRGASKVPGVGSVDDSLTVHASAEGVSSLQGWTRPRRRRPDVLQENWSPTTRLATGVAGFGLMGAGRRLGGLSGLLLRGGGLAMATRAATNKRLSQVTGIGAGRNAVDTETAVTIDAPPEKVWPLVSDYANFPTFMANVIAVQPLADDGVSRWTVRGPAHADITFDAQETLREDGERICWKTLPGQTVAHAGDIAVHAVDGRSRVQVRMHYNPIGGEIGHGVARLLGSDAGHLLRADLLRLRDLVESGKRDRKSPARSATKTTKSATKSTTKATTKDTTKTA